MQGLSKEIIKKLPQANSILKKMPRKRPYRAKERPVIKKLYRMMRRDMRGSGIVHGQKLTSDYGHGSIHPAFRSTYGPYIRLLSNKTGGSIFGSIWNGLKSAHNWIKNNKVISRVGTVVGAVADPIANAVQFVHPGAAAGIRMAGKAAKFITPVAEKFGYGMDYRSGTVPFYGDHFINGRGVPLHMATGVSRGRLQEEMMKNAEKVRDWGWKKVAGKGILEERTVLGPHLSYLSGVPINSYSGKIVT